MTVGKRISATAAALVGGSVLLAAASLVNISILGDRIHLLQEDAIPGTFLSGKILSSVLKLELEMLSLVSGASGGADRARAEAAERGLHDDVSAYERTITLEEDRALFGHLAAARRRMLESWNAFNAQAASGDRLGRFRAEVAPALDALKSSAERLSEWNRAWAAKNADAAAAAAKSAKWWNWTVASLIVGVGLIVPLIVVRGINRALRAVIGELREGAVQVANAAMQVAESSQSLAQGASEQAASVEQASASSEEIHTTSENNSDHSREAAELMTRSNRKFEEANQLLNQSVEAMTALTTQSGKISKVIHTIDEIAFQTNILALNAAVEAARAGEAGLGFAVVADEVRTLAQRCGQATRDTAALIEESITRSGEGKKKVDEVADAIREVTADVSKVKSLIDAVNAASLQQTTGTAEIAKGIAQVEKVTQRTAAAAEEAASAAEELNAQSEAMKAIVSRLSALIVSESTAPATASTRAA
ncbi:MAG: methyl-accepting chemotaxis protein [Bryobacteraceae bacterium]|nr:methyl-accepting chemotaxis protein [Bryobacteraceae bacterium]